MRRKLLATIEDGVYWATCRERTGLAAAANGHGLVFPQATMTVRDGWAYFERAGERVWECNADYAAMHFDVQAK